MSRVLLCGNKIIQFLLSKGRRYFAAILMIWGFYVGKTDVKDLGTRFHIMEFYLNLGPYSRGKTLLLCGYFLSNVSQVITEDFSSF